MGPTKETLIQSDEKHVETRKKGENQSLVDGSVGQCQQSVSAPGGRLATNQRQRLRPGNHCGSGAARSQRGPRADAGVDTGRAVGALECSEPNSSIDGGAAPARLRDARRIVNGVHFPADLRLEILRRQHPRKSFHSGEPKVDEWLATKALQHQDKHLSVTKVLLDSADAIAGYYTLATAQVDFGDLPPEVRKGLPRRALPVAVLAWLGVEKERHGQGLGRLLLAQALRD